MLTRSRKRRLVLPVFVAIVAMLGSAMPVQAATSCFTQTGQCIGDPFNSYWLSNGGLPVFGYPVTTLAPETSPDTSQVYLTQWFERESLEQHPENAAPYTILLGRLGVQRLQQQGRDWTTFPKADPGRGGQADCQFFAETGHSLCGLFLDYWQSHGLDLGEPNISSNESLALFGYPISEPAMETNSSGDTVSTQWFERARFELHPETADPYKVLLGLLGSEVHGALAPQSVPSYENRTASPVEFLISYYNAINRQDYQRAYSYWESPGQPGQPSDYASFAQGFADTAHVDVTLGTPQIDPGAGNVFGSVPAVVVATHTDGSVHTFSGCYTTHHTQPGIDPDPNAALWKLRSASIAEAPAGGTPATLLPQTCQS